VCVCVCACMLPRIELPTSKTDLLRPLLDQGFTVHHGTHKSITVNLWLPGEGCPLLPSSLLPSPLSPVDSSYLWWWHFVASCARGSRER
jgi:hypothetical protein